MWPCHHFYHYARTGRKVYSSELEGGGGGNRGYGLLNTKGWVWVAAFNKSELGICARTFPVNGTACTVLLAQVSAVFLLAAACSSDRLGFSRRTELHIIRMQGGCHVIAPGLLA